MNPFYSKKNFSKIGDAKKGNIFSKNIYCTAKGIQYTYDIIIVLSRHVETVVSLSHKKADTHINVNVELGDEEGQIPINEIARKAEEGIYNKKVT